MSEAKQAPTMRQLLCALPLAAVLALLALPAAQASAAEPWWQLLTSSRPTNLQVAPDQSEVQEVKTTKGKEGSDEFLVAKVEVGGVVVGCLGTGGLFGGAFSADTLCEQQTGFPASETAVEFAAMLEAGPYGPGVEVSGGPAGGDPFLVTTTGRWVTQPIVVTSGSFGSVPLGSATAEVTSEGSGRLVITLTNLGSAPVEGGEVPLSILDSLPAGAEAYAVQAEAGTYRGKAGPVECALPDTSEVSCSFAGELPAYEAIEVEVLVALQAGAGASAGAVSVSGGGAPPVSEPQRLNLSAAPVPFGLERFSIAAEEQGGTATSAAGAHPFQLTTTIVANSGPQSGPDRRAATVAQPALPRNLRFTLPAGLLGNATAAPKCTMGVFLQQTDALTNECPDSSAIGVSSVAFIEGGVTGLARIAVPVFNLVPGRGEPARFGLMIAGNPVLIGTAVDPTDSYRISAEVRNVTQLAQFLAATTTLWGNPGSPAHDASRGWNCAYKHGAEDIPGECVAPGPGERRQTPFLRMPVSCASPLGFDAAFEPWNVPLGSVLDRASSLSPALGACNQVPFDPEISNALTSKLAANPSGFDFQLEMPNSGLLNPKEGAIAEAQPKKVEVTLPEGVTINPSQAEGLATCDPGDYVRERYDSAPGEGCPEAAKIGSVRVSTPLLDEEANGALYVATPYENPTGSLIGLYLVAKIPERGILVKQAGKVEPDPRTGQLVSTFDDIPQLPFSSFELHFREGGRSPLVTPPGCGAFTTLARFTPWSAQDPDDPAPGEIVTRTASLTIDRGVDGGPCPQVPAPFSPGFEAGTLNNQAGTYSPFLMRLTRSDGEQDMGRFSFVLPPGVVPKLAGIPYCTEAGIARAAARQGPHGGREEIDDPSCPAAARIGRTVAGAGVGNQLTYVTGRLYLAGPYKGAPISAVAITPAVAGPFDAGTVVVREGLRLNPVTHVGEVDGAASDPIPHILKGIPLNLRDLRVYADKPEFTLNATSCEPFQARSTIWGEGTALEPRAPAPVELSSRYQAAGCRALGFKPRLGLKLRGGTKRGGFPALRAVYSPRKGDANLQRLALTFPSSEFIEQGHFRTICTRVQFAAGPGFGANCPKGSIYGQAKVWTPLLDEPLKGPVYLRSSNNNLPDAVFALHGLVDIEVSVRIDSVRGRLRAIVQNVPDAPVSRAIVRMRGGQKGLFVNSRNLCVKAKRNWARANLKGKNGLRSLTKPVMRAVRCAKQRKRARKGHRRAGATTRAGAGR